jgi:hypothetical protein
MCLYHRTGASAIKADTVQCYMRVNNLAHFRTFYSLSEWNYHLADLVYVLKGIKSVSRCFKDSIRQRE